MGHYLIQSVSNLFFHVFSSKETKTLTYSVSSVFWQHSVLSRLNEVGELFSQFFVLLFAIIGFAALNTSDGKSLLMMSLVFAIFLYYLALVLVTILQLHIKSYLPFMLVILLLGSVVSILALMVISPTIAWIYLGLWIFLFALMCYENQKELFLWIPKMIKNVIDGQSSNDDGMSSHNLEMSGVESLPV